MYILIINLLRKVLGLTVREYFDLKPGTVIIYQTQAWEILSKPAPHVLRKNVWQIDIKLLHTEDRPVKISIRFTLFNGWVNWLGIAPRHLNLIERLFFYWVQYRSR